MHSMDDFLRLQSCDPLSRLNRNRERYGLRERRSVMDVNAFLSACGVKGKRK